MPFAHVVPRGRRIGMVRHFAHDEAASDEWLPCDGAVIDPDDYPALQAALAAASYPFGGDADGAAVPDIRGRSPMGASGALALGDAGGAEEVTLVTAELPSHTHSYRYGDAPGPGGGDASWLKMYGGDIYDSGTGGMWGGNDGPHDNVQPSLVGRWMIYAGCVAARGGGVEGPTIGEVRAFATAEDVPGWALCGTPASRADYPWLWAHYAQLGYPYGVGDGATTFGTPGTAGRVLMGDGTGDGLTERTIGDSVGAETVTLVDGQLPDHTHGFAAPIRRAELVATGGGAGTNNSTPAFGNTGSAGGDQPHNNMAPTVAMTHRVYAGTDPVPEGGLLGGMPVLVQSEALTVPGTLIEFPMSVVSDPGVVLFIHDWSAADTWGGLFYLDGEIEEAVELTGARLAVVSQSAGARIHVCYLDPAQAALVINESGWSAVAADITLGEEGYLVWHATLVSGVGNAPPTCATSAAASTNPVGPSISVTDDTIAVTSALATMPAEFPLSPVSGTAVLAGNVGSEQWYGSLSATDEAEAGTYVATWANPESVAACAAVVLIPRRLVP